jgi:hypothetical protein
MPANWGGVQYRPPRDLSQMFQMTLYLKLATAKCFTRQWIGYLT